MATVAEIEAEIKELNLKRVIIKRSLTANTEDLVARHENERESFESRYYSISGKFNKLITENPAIIFNPSVNSGSNNRNSSVDLASDSVNSDKTISTHSKLPFLSLPKFTGTYEMWLGFSNTFKALVDDRSEIKNVFTNYKVAWKLLQDRYDNKKFREKWEDLSSEAQIPTMKEFLEFLQRRAQFEQSQFFQSSKIFHNKSEKKPENKPDNKQEHTIYSCEKFLNLSPKERQEAVKKNSLCTNCLHPNQRVNECHGGPCRICGKRDNSLLHVDRENIANSEKNSQKNSSVNMQAHSVQDDSDAYMLLSTAVVDIFDNEGKPHTCQILLDNGSQSNYMTEKMASLLKIPKYPVDIDVSGLNSVATEVKNSVVASIKSRFNNYEKTLNFLLVDQVTKKLPAIPLDRNSFQIPSNIYLADPEFYKRGEIHALSGVRQFYRVLCSGQIEIQGQETIFQKTKLGWVVSDTIYPKISQRREVVSHLSQTEVNSTSDEPSKFWEIEEVPSVKLLPNEEKYCEDHFELHTTRSKTGRYIVSLHFNDKKKKYSEFIQEYKRLCHMFETQENVPTNHGFFLPHHAVLKDNSLTTKIRVVFDGSAKSSSCISLNGSLMVGSTVQDDLFTIYTRFRSFSFALTADIEKMYRQVEVTHEGSAFQKILWRQSSFEPIKTYQLKTVTYGTASAPFLATRVLSQLAKDEGHSYLVAAQVLTRDFYVDDLLTGAASFKDALDLRNELVELVGKDTIKTLGLCWHSREDTILYVVKELDNTDKITKRIILSEIAKIFDPLGLLGPITLYDQLPSLNEIRFNRCVLARDTINVQMHGFCNASEKGYGACIYLRSTDKQGQHHSSLVCSKSRVAPVQTITLPRLELCAALLLSRLYEATVWTLQHVKFSQTIFWSDSTVALHWINTPPHTLKTFVSNRVAKIQEIIQNVANITWRHVPTNENPADLCSRGQLPDKFMSDIVF
ncbi:uncharacterized protein LOC117180750 [Belonocnema kinseyi]|uniref:uncharacterized protein LOC117180750 n=1 Tax=Belonocnema kinseyi TaxID=2817044 RepID=UPI00143CCB4A|nr:uncharacterized protein LOC117180750 [Belonocnema kinseyi]